MTLRMKLMVSLLVAGTSAAAQTNAWELGHPDAKLLLGIDLKGLRESAAGETIQKQMNAQPAQTPAVTSFQSSFQAMALGILEQIDRVFLSSPANPTATAKNNPPFLLVVEARFPMAQLKPFLQGTPRRYRTADVYRTSKTDTTSVALLGEGMLLLGDEKSVLAAIDRRGRALPPASALLARAQKLASTHDFWVIADESLSKFQPANASSTNPLASQIAAQIKGLEFGLAVRDGFQLELNLATENEAAASQIAQLFSTQVQTAALAQANNPEVAEMVSKLQIGSEGNRMRLSLALTQDEFERQVRAAQAAQAARLQTATPAPSPRPATRPVKPATPGKIIIYGLEGGPREIQTTH